MSKLGMDKTLQIGNRGSNTNFDPDTEMGHKWVIHFIRFVRLLLNDGGISNDSENKVQYPQQEILSSPSFRVDLICL